MIESIRPLEFSRFNCHSIIFELVPTVVSLYPSNKLSPGPYHGILVGRKQHFKSKNQLKRIEKAKPCSRHFLLSFAPFRISIY
ncbi:callose synthase 7-like isoform X1 [Gossypium australe]|uniref:Callose synthase 7-like isoform X1 n=1 Tax=Gossypium australe TaxID=47621 RepID=A0A5B6V2Y2_9ROSI|nr:callose synthase 7-like isoform X1 [Gossypium australe]